MSDDVTVPRDHKVLCTDPRTIGYWARDNDLALDDLLTDGRFGDYLGEPDQQQEFREGWWHCDTELRNDKITALLDDLADVAGDMARDAEWDADDEAPEPEAAPRGAGSIPCSPGSSLQAG